MPVAEGCTECEADGMNEVMWASDGPISDSEIRTILAELPSGVDMTLVLNQQSAGKLINLNVGSKAANIVSIASSADGEMLYGAADNTTFVAEFQAVLQEHPDYTWNQVAAEINSRIPQDQNQTINVSASNRDFLDTPIFSGSPTSYTDGSVMELTAAQADTVQDGENDENGEGQHGGNEYAPLAAGKGGGEFGGSSQDIAEDAGHWIGEVFVMLKVEIEGIESKPREPLPEELQGYDINSMMM